MDGARPVILLIDDDRAVLESFRRSLEDLGPLIAHDGAAARGILSEASVDVVVCDLEMPGMSGLELMTWARAHCPSTEWIVVTGAATLDATIQALKLGAFDFICKPVASPMQLRTAVANAARHKRLLAEVAESRAVALASRESERQVRQLVENIPDLAWSARADGHVEFCNHRWYEYTGTTFEQMQEWGWKSVLHAEILDQAAGRWMKALATGEPFDMDLQLRRSDGVYRWFSTRVRPLRDPDAGLARWFGTCTDIEEARNARAERERLIEDLRQSLGARDEFLVSAAHELRSPLTILQLELDGTARLLQRVTGPGTTKFLDKLAVASRQVERLTALVNGLLDAARCAQGKLTLEAGDVDLAAVVRAVIERFDAKAKRARCAVTVEADREVRGFWDRARLEQVVAILIGNALKYGAGHPIQASLRSVDGFAELRVQDRGIGIRREHVARVFARYGRGVSTDSYGGFGLGLYIALQIVEAHGGTIDVVSEVGHGATFTARIPLLRASPTDANRAKPS